MLASMVPRGMSVAVSDVGITGELFAQPARLQPCLGKVGRRRAARRMNSEDVRDCNRESFWRINFYQTAFGVDYWSWSKGEWGDRELRAIWLNKDQGSRKDRVWGCWGDIDANAEKQTCSNWAAGEIEEPPVLRGRFQVGRRLLWGEISRAQTSSALVHVISGPWGLSGPNITN